MKRKKAVITGFSGQDGSYLAKFLLQKDYEVFGVVRRTSNPDYKFIEEMHLQDAKLVEGDLADAHSINQIVQSIQPDEFYNLAAQSHVGTSFKQPEHTGDITGLGVVRILEAIRNYCPSTKFYQASTSELFGSQPGPQDENTPFLPNSPYAAAKLYAHNMVRIYRESYGLFACAGILFNHESERRSKDFVTRKITSWIAKYLKDPNCPPLQLGNLNAIRDWSHAEDMVRGMYLMLQKSTPKDYVLGRGRGYTVREFLEAALDMSWIEYELLDDGTYIDYNTGKPIVQINPSFYRPLEVNHLVANPRLARIELNWEPLVSFEQLVYRMLSYDKDLVYVNTKNQSNQSKTITPVT